MDLKNNQHGGRRKNAGRKPLTDGKEIEALNRATIYLPQYLIDYSVCISRKNNLSEGVRLVLQEAYYRDLSLRRGETPSCLQTKSPQSGLAPTPNMEVTDNE